MGTSKNPSIFFFKYGYRKAQSSSSKLPAPAFQDLGLPGQFTTRASTGLLLQRVVQVLMDYKERSPKVFFLVLPLNLLRLMYPERHPFSSPSSSLPPLLIASSFKNVINAVYTVKCSDRFAKNKRTNKEEFKILS